MGDVVEQLRIVLCDTNKQELEGYATICRAICERNSIFADLKTYSSSDDLLFDMDDDEFSSSVDIFIVDPDNGFQAVAPTVRGKGYDGMILFVSHSESTEYYRQAFDVSAYNFLQKGTDTHNFSRFQTVFESAIKSVQQFNRQFLAVSYGGEYARIEIKDILFFETAADHLINVVYVGGSFKFSSTIQSLEKRFSSRGFIRVHRSYLVSVNAIHRMDSGSLTLNNGNKILVSRDRYPSLKAAMFCWQS